MKKLRSNGSLEGVLLGLVLVLSGCTEAHDVDAILGPPAFAGTGGGDGDGDGDTGDGDGDGDQPGDGDGDGDQPGDGDGDGDTGGCDNCPPSGGAMFGVTACCTDDNKCGSDVSAIFGGGGCLQQDAPGTPDDNCPSFSFMGAFTLDGCCKADGTCGINDTFLGLGCTENPDGNGENCQPSRGGRGGPQ